MFKHILVPVDGSKNAIEAVEKATALAALTGGKITLLTVYRHHSMLEASFSMVRGNDPGNMDDIMRNHARQVIDEAREHAQKHGATEVKGYVKNGAVARSIVEFAEKHEVDLIVIGSRGLGSIESYLLGSVSHKVTGMAECPVLVV